MFIFIILTLLKEFPVWGLILILSVGLILLSMASEVLTLYRNEWKLTQKMNFLQSTLSRKKRTSTASMPYSKLKSMEIVYIARRRIGVRDMGMDVFYLAFIDSEGKQTNFDVTEKIGADIPSIADFLSKKGVQIQDKWGVVDCIKNRESLYESMHLKQLEEIL